MNAIAGEAADDRQMGRRYVDRAAPGVLDPEAVQRREHADQSAFDLGGDAGIDLGASVQAGARHYPASAPPEGDPAIRGRAEVLDGGPRVGDALATGPADRLQHVR